MLLRKKVFIIIFSILCAAWLLVNILFSEKAPKRNLTMGAIIDICMRHNIYVQSNGQPPDSISKLPGREGFGDITQDGWGNKMSYSYDSQKNNITICSYGRDGIAGGAGEDTDILIIIDLDDQYRIPDTEIRKIFSKTVM